MSKRQPVPRTSVFKSQPNKPLTRRPTTACQGCRNAKTACSGKQPCKRCSTKQLPCFPAATLRPRLPSPVRDIDAMMSEHSNFNDSMDISPNQPVQPIEPRPTLPPEPSASSSSSQETHTDEPEVTLDSSLDLFDWVYSDKAAEPVANGYGQMMASDETRTGRGPDKLDNSQDKKFIDMRHKEQYYATCLCRSKMHEHVRNLENASEKDSSNDGIVAMVEQARPAIISCKSYAECSHCAVGQMDLVCILVVVEKINYCLQKVSCRRAGKATNDTCTVDLGGFRLPLEPEQAIEVNRQILCHLVTQTEALLCCAAGLAGSFATSRRTSITMPRCLAQQIAQAMHDQVMLCRSFLSSIKKLTH